MKLSAAASPVKLSACVSLAKLPVYVSLAKLHLCVSEALRLCIYFLTIKPIPVSKFHGHHTVKEIERITMLSLLLKLSSWSSPDSKPSLSNETFVLGNMFMEINFDLFLACAGCVRNCVEGKLYVHTVLIVYRCNLIISSNI